MTKMLTFPEYFATMQKVDDINRSVGQTVIDDFKPQAGYVFAGFDFIEVSNGELCLTISNMGWAGPDNDETRADFANKIYCLHHVWNNDGFREIVNNAAQCGDLDESCRMIQAAIGQTDGGIAGIFFSGTRQDEWRAMSSCNRKARLTEYIYSEQIDI